MGQVPTLLVTMVIVDVRLALGHVVVRPPALGLAHVLDLQHINVRASVDLQAMIVH